MFLKEVAQLVASHLFEEGECTPICFKAIIKGKHYNIMHFYVDDTPFNRRLIYKLNIDKLKPTSSSPTKVQLPDSIKELFEEASLQGEINLILSKKEPWILP